MTKTKTEIKMNKCDIDILNKTKTCTLSKSFKMKTILVSQ